MKNNILSVELLSLSGRQVEPMDLFQVGKSMKQDAVYFGKR